MEYNAIPYWLQTKTDDPFDYALRKKEDVYYQMFLNPPLFKFAFLRKNKIFNVTRNDKMTFNRHQKIKLVFSVSDMNLFPMQHDRLFFLLGQRYKEDGIVKLVINHTDNFKTNIGIGMDIVKQLFLESMRAPLELHNKSLEEKEFITKIYGGHEKYKKVVEFYQDKTTPEYQDFITNYYPRLNDKSLSQDQKTEIWEEISKKRSQTKRIVLTFQEHDEDDDDTSSYDKSQNKDKKTTEKELSYREVIKKLPETWLAKKNVLSEKIGEDEGKLSQEAYEMFYKDGDIRL